MEEGILLSIQNNEIDEHQDDYDDDSRYYYDGHLCFHKNGALLVVH